MNLRYVICDVIAIVRATVCLAAPKLTSRGVSFSNRCRERPVMSWIIMPRGGSGGIDYRDAQRIPYIVKFEQVGSIITSSI